MEAKKILGSVVYAIIAPELMCQFTMTGKTAIKNVTKNRLKTYVNILNISWRVINAADASYTKGQFEKDITSRIVKYAYKFRFVNK